MLFLICGLGTGVKAQFKTEEIAPTHVKGGLSEGIVTYINYGKSPNTKPSFYSLIYSNGKSRFLPKGLKSNEQIYTDFKQQALIRILSTKGKRMCQVSSFEKLVPELETEDTIIVLGKICYKFSAQFGADNFDSWVWKESGIRGSPDLRFTPETGLVMAIDYNGRRQWQATQLEVRKVKSDEMSWPALKGPYSSADDYQTALEESGRVEIPLMEHELIARESDNPSFDHFTRTEKFAGGTLLLKKIKIPAIKETDHIFLKLSTYSNGDPLPRNGSVFILPMDKRANLLTLLQKSGSLKKSPKNSHVYPGIQLNSGYMPPLELMRFSTPYGVRFFNKQISRKNYTWADSAVYRQEITDLKEVLNHEVWLGVFIASDNHQGNIVSLKMEIYPNETKAKLPIVKQFLVPLIFTVNTLGANGGKNDEVFQYDSLELQFSVPEGFKNARLRYIGTSTQEHDPQKETKFEENEILLDDETIAHYVPVRNDCGSFRNLNPASPVDKAGFFESDRSQAGWCPGSITHPIYFTLPEMEAGKHILKVAVPRDEDSPRSKEKWQVSISLLGDIEK